MLPNDLLGLDVEAIENFLIIDPVIKKDLACLNRGAGITLPKGWDQTTRQSSLPAGAAKGSAGTVASALGPKMRGQSSAGMGRPPHDHGDESDNKHRQPLL